MLISIIMQVKKSIYKLDKQIQANAAEVPEVQVIKKRLGIKENYLIGTIVGNLGDISRFSKDSKMAAYCGLAPARFQSGRINTYSKPTRYSRVLKKAFVWLAMTRIKRDLPSRKYYQRKRRQGMAHWQALLRLARQLCKIVYYDLKNYHLKNLT
jgi:transposase